ncbi:MAG TPA: PH domain-containing protein [Candidatus Saccharibacteria bacterium]|nr:PH domain-containing protein [Candidatus Saccharibacteria bacterium]
MRDLKDIERELISIGSYIRFVGRPALRELPKILVDGEKIKHCLNIRYEGGVALLCVTNFRVLLIDKKPFFLMLEDIRYDMIMEVDYGYQMFSGQVKMIMPNKKLTFRAFKKDQLRDMTTYVQNRVLTSRQQHDTQHTVIADNRLVPDMPIGAPAEIQPNEGYISSNLENPEVLVSVPKAIHPYIQSTLTVRKQLSRY